MTFGRYSQNLGTDVSSMGCYCLGDALFRMQTQISTRISAPLHHYRWGLCCFQSLKTCPVTAAKEVTREEKHGQRRSAIHSSHRCPAACAGRNRPVSSPCPTAEWALQCAGEVKSRRNPGQCAGQEAQGAGQPWPLLAGKERLDIPLVFPLNIIPSHPKGFQERGRLWEKRMVPVTNTNPAPPNTGIFHPTRINSWGYRQFTCFL